MCGYSSCVSYNGGYTLAIIKDTLSQTLFTIYIVPSHHGYTANAIALMGMQTYPLFSAAGFGEVVSLE